jgi:DNA-binding LacI/PurR family transcriptional regulator
MNIKQIAKLAGVSVATISRVMNTPEKVKPETLQKVQETMNKHQYTTNPFARNLMKERTKNIVGILPSTNSPFPLEVAEGAEDILAKEGYILTLLNTHKSMHRQSTLLDFMREKKNSFFMDGLLLIGSAPLREGYQKSLQSFIKTPIVAVDKGPLQHPLDSAYMDESAGVFLAFKHLYEKGHKIIGLIAGEPDYAMTKRRLQDIHHYVDLFQMQISEVHIRYGSLYDMESGYIQTARMLEASPKPTAIFAFNDILSIGCMKYLLAKGYKIPGDISVVSGDATHLGQFYHPSITGIKSPSYEIGQKAAELLLKRITHPDLPSQNIILPPSLIIRET